MLFIPNIASRKSTMTVNAISSEFHRGHNAPKNEFSISNSSHNCTNFDRFFIRIHIVDCNKPPKFRLLHPSHAITDTFIPKRNKLLSIFLQGTGFLHCPESQR